MRTTISCRYCIAFEVMLLFLVLCKNRQPFRLPCVTTCCHKILRIDNGDRLYNIWIKAFQQCWICSVTFCRLPMGVSGKHFSILFYFAHQHKAAGVKTKQDVNQRLQRLLIRCSLCWGRRPHSPAAELWTGVETERLSLVSWVMTVVRLPISWTSSMSMSSHVPAVSMAMG